MKAARLEERLAITDRAQSTVVVARRLRDENGRLRSELEGLRERPEERRSWWRRVFGG